MQSMLFEEDADAVFDSPPAGLSYQGKFISASEEIALLRSVRELPFKNFEFHGYQGKRRTVSFGWHYEFSGAGRLKAAADIPQFLFPLRARAAAFAQLRPEALEHVLVIEYEPGAGIGWHLDKPVFDKVIAVSLLARCILRFRRKVKDRGRPATAADAITSGHDGAVEKQRAGSSRKETNRQRSGWERFKLSAEPRSAYLLDGPARHVWEHSILRVDSLRYSITFRSMREPG